MKRKTIVIAGADGLIGSCLFNNLGAYYNIIGVDVVKRANRYIDKCNIATWDLTDYFLVDRVFSQNDIIAYINCAYPKGFVEHSNFFIKTTEIFADRFKKYGIKGSIINMASIYGIVGPDKRIYENTDINEMPNWYAAAKGAVIAHSRCIATKYAEYGIKVNCIAPGGVYDYHDIKFVDKYNNRVPMKTMIVPSEICKVVDFLLMSDVVTGQTLVIDGGLTSW